MRRWLGAVPWLLLAASGAGCQDLLSIPDVRLALGTAGESCQYAGDCRSGFCPRPDRVCCETACDQPCMACNSDSTGAPDGQCAPVLAGKDPRDVCKQDLEGCGSTGECNGDPIAPGCALKGEGADCSPGTCDPATNLLASAGACDGLGTCIETAPTSCQQYACNDTLDGCRTDCAVQDDCAAGFYCDPPSCLAQQDQGGACSDDDECATGSCAPPKGAATEGTCCDEPCGGLCQRCDGQVLGTCETLPEGFEVPGCGAYSCSGFEGCHVACDDSTACATSHYCNDGGACVPQKDLGEPCSSDAECFFAGQNQGYCVDGLCCESMCMAECYACTAQSTGDQNGECEPITANTDPDGECTTGSCDGTPAGACTGAGAPWSLILGDPVDAMGTAVASASDLDVVHVGYFTEVTIDGDALATEGSQDGFVIRRDTTGQTIDWYVHLAAEAGGGVMPRAVAVDAQGNTLVVGELDGLVDVGGSASWDSGVADGVFVLALDAAGAYLWSETLEADYLVLGGAALDSQGGVVFAASYAGTLTGGARMHVSQGQEDIVVAHVSDMGVDWSRSFGDASEQLVHGIDVDGDDAIVMAGGYFGTPDFGGGPLVAGGAGFVVKLDADGDHLWSTTIDGTDDGGSMPVTFDGDGDVVVAGSFTSQISVPPLAPVSAIGFTDAFLLKLTGSGGAPVFVRGFGDAIEFGDVFPRAITTKGATIIMAGDFTGTVEFGPTAPLLECETRDAFVVRFDDVGGHDASADYGSLAAEQGARGLTVDLEGRILVTGFAVDAINFGQGTLFVDPLSDGDAFLAKLGL